MALREITRLGKKFFRPIVFGEGCDPIGATTLQTANQLAAFLQQRMVAIGHLAASHSQEITRDVRPIYITILLMTFLLRHLIGGTLDSISTVSVCELSHVVY